MKAQPVHLKERFCFAFHVCLGEQEAFVVVQGLKPNIVHEFKGYHSTCAFSSFGRIFCNASEGDRALMFLIQQV